MKLLKGLFATALLLSNFVTSAQSANEIAKIDALVEDALKPTPPPLAKIEKVLHDYAETLGCDFSMNRKNIVEIDIDKDEEGEKEFVALFNLDVGCLGGSGTGKSHIAVLKYRDVFHKDTIYVRAEMSEPSIASYGFPRFVDRLFIKEGQLWYSGRVHREGDGNNFPTTTVQSQAKLMKKELIVNSIQSVKVFYWQSSKNDQSLVP